MGLLIGAVQVSGEVRGKLKNVSLSKRKLIFPSQTLYIYLGIGALVGGALGLLLAFVSGSLQGPLGLNSKPEDSGRTAKQYRQDKRKKKATSGTPFLSPGYSSPNQISMSDSSRRSSRGKGVIGQTIMEELDSDY